jgi:hypothetical protein
VLGYLQVRRKRAIALVLILFAAIDWAALDRWQTSGMVVDASKGQQLSGAWILAKFNGKKPLIRLPIPPHPMHRTGECMGLHATRTDARGHFAYSEVTYNRALAEKSAYLTVFKPGWIARSASFPLRTSILAWAPGSARVELQPGPGKRRDTSATWTEETRSRLGSIEFTYSEELFSTLSVVSRATWWSCDAESTEVLVSAMNHALNISATLDERARSRSMCLLAAHKLEAEGLSWPFDCRNLQFNHQPSSEVLAIERELEAKRTISSEGISESNR